MSFHRRMSVDTADMPKPVILPAWLSVMDCYKLVQCVLGWY